jgi:hypothetical protein
MTIEFHEDKESYLLDISSMLYDLELTHDYSVITANKELYSNYHFNRFFWYRKGRPILKEHRIRALKIVKESPLIIEVVIPSLGAIWILLQIFEKISNWNLNKEKLRLEVDKLHREEMTAKREEIEICSDKQWPGNIEIDPSEIEKKLISRLVEINIKPREIEIREHKKQ